MRIKMITLVLAIVGLITYEGSCVNLPANSLNIGALKINEMQKEIWRDIPNYEDYYQVSSFGRVKRLRKTNNYGRTYCERIKKLIPSKKINHK